MSTSKQFVFKHELEKVYRDELKRLQSVWGTQKYMTFGAFSEWFLSHPDISEDTCAYIYDKACFGSPHLSFESFALFTTILTRASSKVRKDFFSGCESKRHDLKQLIEVGVDNRPSSSHNIYSLYGVLSGVTHFDDFEVANLEKFFSKVFEKKFLKITRKGFRALLKGVLSEKLIDSLFTVFNESGNGLISFKEFVCALSALFFGPDIARINYMLQIWDENKEGFLSRHDISVMFNFFKISADLNTIPWAEDENKISIVDFLCWMLASDSSKKLAQDLISLSDQMKYFSFGFMPSSDSQSLELVCGVKNRILLSDLDEWCVIPSTWWSKLVVSLCPRMDTILPLEDYEALLTKKSKDFPINSNCIMLREGLRLHKDYELVPLFLWRALCKWTAQDCVEVAVERCCLSKKFLPNGGWPIDNSWGPANDFPSDYFVELYPLSIQFLRHKITSKQNLSVKSLNEESLYITWNYMNLSRSISIGKLCAYLSRCCQVSTVELRLWSLKLDGRACRSLLSTTTDTLHSFGVLSSAQLLVEIRNDDLSWPEELIHFYTNQCSISRVNSDNAICQMKSTGDAAPCDSSYWNEDERLKRLSSTSLLFSGERDFSVNYEPTFKPAGVVNMGNTCYMSAAIQSVSNIDILSKFVLDITDDSDSSTKNLSSDDKSGKLVLTLQYGNILKNLIVKNESVVPRSIKDLLAQKAGLFGDRLQHDCQEFLQIFFDLLHKELSTLALQNAASEYFEEYTSYSDLFECSKAWKKHKERENSIIVDLFDGQLKSSLKCLNCGDVSSNFEIFSCVQLSLPNERFLFVSIKVIKRNYSFARRYALRVPIDATLSYFKKTFCKEFNMDADCIAWLILDNEGNTLHDFCGFYRDSEMSDSIIFMKYLLEKNISFFAYELLFSVQQNDAVMAIHRMISHKATCAIQQVDGVEVSIFGIPFFVQYPNITKCGERFISQLYENTIDAINHDSNFFSKKNAMLKDGDDLSEVADSDKKNASSNTRVNRAIDANEDSRFGFPFELSFTKRDGLWCSKCHWSMFCRGCLLDASSKNSIYPTMSTNFDENIVSTNNNIYALNQYLLAVNWKPEAFYLKYNYSNEMLVDNDESYNKCLEMHQKSLSLDDCFREFIRAEIIEDSKCEKCSMNTNREKSMKFCKFPNILVIHLKRFVFVPKLERYVKFGLPVTFPLDDFDPSEYLADEHKGIMKQKYRCISIVNHLGEMNCGHYTTYIRRAERWYFFNDSFSDPIKEEQIKKENAYLLFYERI